MTESEAPITTLRPSDYARVLATRDARFDGLFFVGITSTRVYCRPICPARVTHHDRRRFFDSAAAAENAGFRPCLRCRPELAPGRSVIFAVSRLARDAADRIAAGALNGRSVSALATDLGVSERHLRRALEREIGVSPIELAQTHRLLLAKRLLADTSLSVTRIAYASGFQSLRRFNTTFRERYRLAPSALRRGRHATTSHRSNLKEPLLPDAIKLTLAYRAPLAWAELLAFLHRDALPGVELVDQVRYTRIVCVEGHTGLFAVENGAANDKARGRRSQHLDVWVSQSLVPATMPLLSRIRRLFDLDSEPVAIDRHLSHGGLADLVRRHPGLRAPGSLDGFEAAFHVLLKANRASRGYPSYAARVIRELGAPAETGDPRLTNCVPTAAAVVSTGVQRLVQLGVPASRANALVAIAGALINGTLRLERGAHPEDTRRMLSSIAAVSDNIAVDIVLRALSWPDAFASSDRLLQRAAGVSSAGDLTVIAERWRPWRAYGALHLWME